MIRKDFTNKQLARIDEVYRATHELCKVLSERCDLPDTMEIIGEIAEFAASHLVKQGIPVRFPTMVTDEEGNDFAVDYYTEGDNIISSLMDALNNYFISEFGEDSAISAIPNDGIIHLAYTTYEFGDDEIRDVQVDFDLANLKYLNYIDDELVLEERRESIEAFIEELSRCDFDAIIADCVRKGFELFGE